MFIDHLLMEAMALGWRARFYGSTHQYIYLDGLSFSPRKRKEMPVILKKDQIPLFLSFPPPMYSFPYYAPFRLNHALLHSFSFNDSLLSFLSCSPVDIEADVHSSRLYLFLRYNIRKMVAFEMSKLTVISIFEGEMRFWCEYEVIVLTQCI